MKGACYWLSDRWAGDWTFEDTVTVDPASSPTMLILNDDGQKGDKQAGDHIWSRNVTYEAGTEGGIRMYKFNMFYPGVGDVPAEEGQNVYENEFHYCDRHHWINITGDEAVVETHDVFNYDSNGLNSFPEGTAIETDNGNFAREFSLSQNYPNPFNPSTVIEYQLAKRGFVELKVYNALGVEMATLVEKAQNAGAYHVFFNAAQFASGVYFYQLRVGESIQMRKMVLLK